jgi:hypothetical protein
VQRISIFSRISARWPSVDSASKFRTASVLVSLSFSSSVPLCPRARHTIEEPAEEQPRRTLHAPSVSNPVHSHHVVDASIFFAYAAESKRSTPLGREPWTSSQENLQERAMRISIKFGDCYCVPTALVPSCSSEKVSSSRR